MQKRKKSKHYHITSFQIIILGFLSVILIGSLLLMLPIATRSGNGASFSDALFYCNISGLCNRIDYTRYGNLLVCVRTEYHFVVDSDWRNGNCYNCCFDCGSFRTQNRADAAKYDARGNRSTKCWWYCSENEVYLKNSYFC